MGLLTQQDPIGIAGGLNLYGYGNGDPINFSDPFGLCPDLTSLDPEDCEASKEATVSVGVGVSAVPGTGPSVGVGITYSGSEGPGLFVSGGIHRGADISATASFGLHTTRPDGLGFEGCAGGGPGIVGGSGCVSGSVTSGD